MTLDFSVRRLIRLATTSKAETLLHACCVSGQNLTTGHTFRAHVPPAGLGDEVMTMAKPTTELGQRCPPPPYTRWDQRGKPVLQASLKLPDGTTFRAMLNTDDRKIAMRRMQLIVVLLVRDGRLPANSGAAQVYGRRPARGVAEVERLAELSREEYAVVRKPAAAKLGLSPPNFLMI